MKKIGFIAVLVSINLNAQEVLTFEQRISIISNTYEDIDYGDKYEEVDGTCPWGEELDNCWKIGSWGYYEGGPEPTPFTVDIMHFYYFPSKKMLAENDAFINTENPEYSYWDFPVFYRLNRIENNSYRTWQYKDDAISITIRGEYDESAWGMHIMDVRIVNVKNDPFIGPLTVTKKY